MPQHAGAEILQESPEERFLTRKRWNLRNTPMTSCRTCKILRRRNIQNLRSNSRTTQGDLTRMRTLRRTTPFQTMMLRTLKTPRNISSNGTVYFHTDDVEDSED